MFRHHRFAAATIVAALFVLSGQAWTKDKPKDDDDANGDHKLPAAVLKTVKHHTPGLAIEHVRTREVKGHPTVYVIDGDWEEKDVLMTVEEDGDIVEIRFRKHDGEKPKKETHPPEALPDAVRKTANRVVPKLKVTDVRATETSTEKVYRIMGTTTEDDEPRSVVLAIEEDGDLLEARIFKPKSEAID